ncbi:hypothetical protein BDU57DRAFT_469628 [Ampelomyces quisqualis]|uniref:Uncharacterized protein n=1 Tax=Ampelomyces quisqualis TaxID=50730 RepID=A0A6A5QVR4_AMPQU|nr:hypothetical protein BDU57DRAFT_469628 [Ampelomyces quisqualis]
MRINFTECAAIFRNDTALQEQWGWRGPLVGIAQNYETQITREGCLEVCGKGSAYYTWTEVSSTLTTWILPVIGTLLQAPFESNAARRTFFAIARWVGSPVASLSYVLWNIKVSAKAALMVDMAVKYDEIPEQRTDFSSMRDSMFLLLVMNQYTMKPNVVQQSKKEAECLLRIALFSRDLQLSDTEKSLRVMRRILARELREMRRRGTVPGKLLFVSILWFLFAFALSVEGAFGNIGQNTTAHDLALGCLLAWFPILIMGSIVDRNPIAAEVIRKKLNHFVDHVRNAVQSEEHRKKFIKTFQDHPDRTILEARVDSIANAEGNAYDFFEEFAGQARVRWHYGAAHAILSDIEHCFIAKQGRNWLHDERNARMNLVLGTINDEGLMWFDIREFWQVGSAIIIVGSSCGGAFILSFFTPTVGLGCRSGGYTIFFSIALGLMIVEMSVWLVTSPYQMKIPWFVWLIGRFRQYGTFNRLETCFHEGKRAVQRVLWDFASRIGSGFINLLIRLALLFIRKNKRATRAKIMRILEKNRAMIRAMSLQRKWEAFFFRPVEVFNSTWLVYIVLAQTFGWYKTCDCVTSTWGGAGGYLDFSVQDTSNSSWVLYYWTAGTCLTGVVLLFSMFYITVEWCQQSFMSTEDYKDAMEGLRMTRDYRMMTYWFRATARFVSRFTFDPLESLSVKFGLIKTQQSTLLWTKSHNLDTEMRKISSRSAPYHAASPSIELTLYPDDLDDLHDESAVQDAPAIAHSLFPPAQTNRRARNGSNAPNTDTSLPIYQQYRTSDETRRSLEQHPPDVHRSRASSTAQASQIAEQRRSSSELSDSRSSGEPLLYPVSFLTEQPTFNGWSGIGKTVHSRQGYQRANSDPGSPPIEITTELEQSGLGIHMRGQNDEAQP